MEKIKIGCCGFPCKREIYYKNFECVEIQETFYSIPKIETALKWKNSAPNDFIFTLKAPQHITHLSSSPTYRRCKKDYGKRENYGFFKNTDEVKRAYDDLREFAIKLSSKYILFQTPPSFKPTCENISNLINFFKERKREPFIFVLELRGWEKKDFEKILKEIDFIHCFDPFKEREINKEIIYWRLHGKGGYNYKYTEEELKELFEMSKNKKGFIFFNNVYMMEDALRFKEIYEGR